MTDASKDYEVGYGKPPAATKWKPGQTGNPRRVRSKRSQSLAELVDHHLARRITVDGRVMSIYEAFLTILDGKTLAGDALAATVLRQYRRYARELDRQIVETEIRIVENGDPRLGARYE